MNTSNAIPLHEQWFVGREEYVQEFEAFLKGERDYRVLFIHGSGGIGKTWLLRKMMTIAKEMRLSDCVLADELIDLYSTSNHSIEGVRENIISLLGENAFPEYRKSQDDLATAEREGFREDILQNMRQQLQADFLTDCRNLSKQKKVRIFFDTFERVQRVQVGSWLLTKLARELPNFRFVIASREKWGGNTYIHPLKLESFSTKDEQEYFKKRGWDTAEPAIKKAIREQAGGHPLRMELALEFLSGNLLRDAGRLRALEEDEFEKALIAPLQEMGQGLFGSRSFDEVIYQTILFMAYFNRRFDAELLELFAAQGAVNIHGLQPEDVLGMLEQKFFFVKTRPDGYIQLHDEMERMINQHLWPLMDPSGEFRRELARIACQWYAEQIERKREAATLDDWKAEQLVYWFDFDLDKASDLLLEYGYVSPMLNTLLTVEIEPDDVKNLPEDYRYRFAIDLGDRARRVYQYKLGQEYWQIAINAARKAGAPDKILDAVLGLHNCTYPMDLDQSLEILFDEALPLCDRSENRRAQVLYEIGFTLSRKQRYLKAIEYYKQAKDAARNAEWMATILNDMGYVYVFLGEYKRAARYVKRGLDLRREQVERFERLLAGVKAQQDIKQLENDLAEARWLLGLSFNTLGQIKRFDGDLAAATGAYSEALEIFSRDDVQDFSWQASALHSRGEAHRRIAMVLFEQGRYDASNDYEERAQNDLQRCLDLCDQYGITEKHTAYRRMGRLLHDQAMRTDDMDNRLDLLRQAKGYFEKGLHAARDRKNVLEELENLTEIAYLVDDRLDAIKIKQGKLTQNDLDLGDQDIERLREVVEKIKERGERGQELFHFEVFQHLLELEEGAFRFVQGDFEQALSFYKAGYAGLARDPGYGSARYHQHLVHLLNQLDKLDQAVAQVWGETFIKTWNETKAALPDGSELTLAQLHPGLVEDIQIYLDTAFLDRV